MPSECVFGLQLVSSRCAWFRGQEVEVQAAVRHRDVLSLQRKVASVLRAVNTQTHLPAMPSTDLPTDLPADPPTWAVLLFCIFILANALVHGYERIYLPIRFRLLDRLDQVEQRRERLRLLDQAEDV